MCSHLAAPPRPGTQTYTLVAESEEMFTFVRGLITAHNKHSIKDHPFVPRELRAVRADGSYLPPVGHHMFDAYFRQATTLMGTMTSSSNGLVGALQAFTKSVVVVQQVRSPCFRTV